MPINRLQHMLEFCYNLSPAQIIKWARILRNQYMDGKMVAYPAPRLTRAYFLKQHNAVLKAFEMLEQGEDFDVILRKPFVLPFGERIVEYPYFYKWIMESECHYDILDVGCVLNNRCVEEVLRKSVKSVWFCNPSIEKSVNISNPIFYHISDLEHSFPNGQQFALVTCLSTIEHIGYDNSQYGVSIPGKYLVPSIEPFIKAFGKLGSLVGPGGALLISFPFGYREVLLNPGTGKISSQVMDYSDLKECLPVFNEMDFSYKLVVYEATPNGWEKTDPVSCKARYANGRPGATAVALIECKKEL